MSTRCWWEHRVGGLLLSRLLAWLPGSIWWHNTPKGTTQGRTTQTEATEEQLDAVRMLDYTDLPQSNPAEPLGCHP